MRLKNLSDIDWRTWLPHQRATLLFVLRDGQILLIHKKRGLGAGKINAPGGRTEPGESPLQAAVRELQEELKIQPVEVTACGELFFQFTDGLAMHVVVFRAADCVGQPQETTEAAPFWFRQDAIPYERMWEDDRHWLPLLLAGQPFRGYFLFDGDRMLDCRIDLRSLPPSSAASEQCGFAPPDIHKPRSKGL